jgi:hypothetical protein
LGVSEDLSALEKAFRQLQIEWDKYFSGIERKPPNELRARVEGMLRRWAYEEIRNNTERFRYQTFTAKYNTFSELWNKKLRAREEGKAFGVHGLKAEILPPPPPPAPAEHESHHRPAAGPAPHEVRVVDPQRDLEAVKTLYQSFVDARRQAGEAGVVKFENFQKLIGQQASRMLGEKGGQAVDFRLETREGKVSLKARVVK